MKRSGCHPVYKNTSVTYFPLGEDKFRELLIRLEQAESFIFLEYFILDEGTMWGEILEILARKAAEGVDVRLMYDGTCELALLPLDYPKRIEKLGIRCKVFAPIKPFVSTHYNYRDHRKILVIDGHTAFTGGINLADDTLGQGSEGLCNPLRRLPLGCRFVGGAGLYGHSQPLHKVCAYNDPLPYFR